MAPPFTLREFNRDLAEVWRASTGKITRSFAFRRLRMLDVNYEFHTLMNETLELEGTRDDLADFESVTKVDNHIHAAGGFTRAELLNFIKRKAREDGDRVVTSDGKTLVEASPYDRVWGIGLRADERRVHDPSKWRGKNLLGEALAEVRTRLRSA